MSRDDKDTVYCNVQIPMTQGRELSRLMAELRASGERTALTGLLKSDNTCLSS